ncbi:MAG: hypothetical protein KY476_26135 [Planctomycetes bacterium]|nr:hypothetical protein [Planctomycetota bacterium]
MEALGQSLKQLWFAFRDLLVALAELLAPWLPLIVALGLWITFWTCAVNWERLRRVLLEGGWIGLVLVGLVTVLVWGTVDPPQWREIRTDDGRVFTGYLLGRTDDTLRISGADEPIAVERIASTDTYHRLLGLKVSNYVGKTVYVTALICIMLLCGSVQLAGCCRVTDPPQPVSLSHSHAAH